LGVKDFFGTGKSVDTTKPFTVVTQFIAPGGTLSEIRRLFKQNGKIFQNPHSTWSGLTSFDSITDPFCRAAKTAFGDIDDFARKGGLVNHGKALGRGVVLVMSLWDDYAAHMLWLDSNYPTDKPASQPGVARGPCPTSSGVPRDVESQYPNAYVRFSNIKVGEIGSTY
jgi:cellulose 1,4-beta-cellobiosidase